ncbi:uncharacterized protein BT62DRAFT_1074373 [Guyanagaster necrorhizus]|uniref:Uncharacterized protein n=1 Tax=Guyanagaster necrorhizus TaxID=856835 RepID=A0A9P8AUT8_9AGAR|nr:uncharacterized protein BT62DRAFT_1074373 [Guyanagaster necrorhizus MCA 3950]KAG7448849.1 hypothetical protein BT62DRAFT_1074373 [Guyanagaster necrorhizus MCA 3950]
MVLLSRAPTAGIYTLPVASLLVGFSGSRLNSQPTAPRRAPFRRFLSTNKVQLPYLFTAVISYPRNQAISIYPSFTRLSPNCRYSIKRELFIHGRAA